LKKLFFPLRGFMKCEVCGCALTASIHKGHHYYYCTNRKEICSEHKSYMRETYLYEKFADILEKVDFTEAKIELMYEAAKEKSHLDSEYLDKALTTLSNELQALKTRESRLLDTFLAEQISNEIYNEKILTIRNEKIAVEKQIAEMQNKSPVAMLEPVKNVFLQASRAKNDFLSGDDNKKEMFLKIYVGTFRSKTKMWLKLNSKAHLTSC
jgi:hypothetical protein